MGNKGVLFHIPNKYGIYLAEILEPLQVNRYQWLIKNDEIHLLQDDEFTNEFLFNKDRLSGEELYETSKSSTYYMISVTLRAFFRNGNIKSVKKHKEFLESDCQIILTVYDCSYVMFWCKDSQVVTSMYMYALSKEYENIKYISEEDLIANKYYIE